MPIDKTVSIKEQVSALATAFILSFCIETQEVLLVFASCVAHGNDESPENREIAQRIGDSHLLIFIGTPAKARFQSPLRVCRQSDGNLK